MPEPAEPDGSELFGPGNTWWGLRTYVLKFTRRTWPGLSQCLVEDAVGEGLARTMDLWVHWRGSVLPGNPGLTYAGAKRHASMAAHKYLKSELQREEPLSVRETPRELSTERGLSIQAQKAIEELQNDDREWDAWARDFLAGESERAVAAREQVSQQAIDQRRKRGLKRARPLLRKHGLIGEEV